MDLEAMGVVKVIKFLHEVLLPTSKLARQGCGFLASKIAESPNRMVASERFLLEERAEVMAEKDRFLEGEVTRIGECVMAYAVAAKADYQSQKEKNTNLIEVAQAWKRWQLVGDYMRSRVCNAELAVDHAGMRDAMAKEMAGPGKGREAKERSKLQTPEELAMEELERHAAIVEEARALVTVSPSSAILFGSSYNTTAEPQAPSRLSILLTLPMDLFAVPRFPRSDSDQRHALRASRT
jgi:hypothetical protein